MQVSGAHIEQHVWEFRHHCSRPKKLELAKQQPHSKAGANSQERRHLGGGPGLSFSNAGHRRPGQRPKQHPLPVCWLTGNVPKAQRRDSLSSASQLKGVVGSAERGQDSVTWRE